jgi:limonene-1,2-epoxide hydrolase
MSKQENKWLPYVISAILVVPVGAAVLWEILTFIDEAGIGEASAGFAMLGLFTLVGGAIILWFLIAKWVKKFISP